MATAEKKVATKRATKIQVKCLENFRDKHTQKIHKKGDVFKVTEERLSEILEVGKFVEKYAESSGNTESK